jgi:hypothetical protein
MWILPKCLDTRNHDIRQRRVQEIVYLPYTFSGSYTYMLPFSRRSVFTKYEPTSQRDAGKMCLVRA